MRRSCNEKGGGQNAKWERSKSNRDGRTGLWSAGHHGGAGGLRFGGIETVAIAARNRGGGAPAPKRFKGAGDPPASCWPSFLWCGSGGERVFIGALGES